MIDEKNKLEDESNDTLQTHKKKALALKFISGKFVGGIYTLPKAGELIIGRSSDSDITIAEEMVSRKHARLIIGPEEHIYIEDLKSTNGTFVNGERIQKAILMEGNRILVGSSILKLVAVEEETKPSQKIPLKSLMEEKLKPTVFPEVGTRVMSAPPPSKTMEGVLDEIPLTDLLQMFSATKKSGVLKLEWRGRTALIHLKEGSITYATYLDLYDMPGRKALFRLLGLNEGKFTMMQYSDPPAFAQLITEPTEYLIMEGLRRLDEQRRLEKELGLSGSSLQFNFPLLHPLKELTPEQMDIFQILYNALPYEMLLDISPYEDLETAQIISELIDKKYIRLL